MKAIAYVPLLAGVGYALPQACKTTTEQVLVPTSTATYLSTYVTTVHATTPQDLGTFTDVVRESSTKTLQTLTSVETDCTANGTITAQPTTTVYTSGGNRTQTIEPNPSNKDRTLQARQDSDCTITKTSTTTYGQTYTFAPADETSTHTQYTAFTQATTTTTSSGGTAYAIATDLTTTPGTCGSTLNATSPTTTRTTTQDARCAPTALMSAAGPGSSSSPGRQYGLSYSERTSSGATYNTNTTDASSCCQLCVDAEKCAASAWDSRSGECRLSFPVEFGSGELSCGLGLQVYYGAGPNHPMEPGTGLFVAEVCGSVAFANAKPDDGT